MTERSGTARAGDTAVYLPQHLQTVVRPDGIVLRLARPGEYDAVADLLDAAFTTGNWVTPQYREGLHRVADRAVTFHVWVAHGGDGRLLGAVLTPRPEFHRGTSFTFSAIGVAPWGRGLGIGRSLAEHAIAVAGAYGYPLIEIHSSPQMTAAHRLYYELGFVRRAERETGVVDAGQRLLTFTYRIPAPTARQDIPHLPAPPVPGRPTPPVVRERGNRPPHPPGSWTTAGEFTLDAPAKAFDARAAALLADPAEQLVLRASVIDPRGQALRSAVRLAGFGDRIAIESPAGSDRLPAPALLDRAGNLVTDDPVAVLRHLAARVTRPNTAPGTTAPGAAASSGTAASRPQAAGGATPPGRSSSGDEGSAPLAAVGPGRRGDPSAGLDIVTATVVEALLAAVHSTTPSAVEASLRVFFAQLGLVDVRLSAQRYLGGDGLGAADLLLFATLLTLDIGYRDLLPWAAGELADYPYLGAYARELFAMDGLVETADLVEIGIEPLDGQYRQPWGIEHDQQRLRALRARWDGVHDRHIS